jgi:N-acetylglucosaminyl-diphospho-decaprenol L-rhamnosyltransferase
VCLNYLDHHPTVGALSPMLVYSNGEPQYCYNRFPGVREELIVTFYLDVYFHQRLVKRDYENRLKREVSLPVDWIAGACILVRRSVLDVVGSFDERFFIFYEDIDLCFRIRSAGFAIHYIPESRIIHKGGRSTSDNPRTLIYHRYRSKYLFVLKHYSCSKQWAIVLLSILGLLLRISATFVFSYGSRREKAARRSGYLESLEMSLMMLSPSTRNSTWK